MKMKLSTAFKISNTLLYSSIVLALILYIMGALRSLMTNYTLYYILFAVTALAVVAGLFVKFTFCRCPHCGANVTSWKFTTPDHCTHCWHRL